MKRTPPGVILESVLLGYGTFFTVPLFLLWYDTSHKLSRFKYKFCHIFYYFICV